MVPDVNKSDESNRHAKMRPGFTLPKGDEVWEEMKARMKRIKISQNRVTEGLCTTQLKMGGQQRRVSEVLKQAKGTERLEVAVKSHPTQLGETTGEGKGSRT